MTKQELRAHVRQRRGEISSTQVETLSHLVVERLVTLLTDLHAQTVFLYLPLSKEVNPLSITFSYISTYFAPRMRGTDLDIVPYHPTVALRSAAFGVLEPIGEPMPLSFIPDAIIVPGVAFDVQGSRVGYGKGYYDRLLSRCPTSVTIGICFDFQLFDSIEGVELHDVGMRHVVTEARTLHL